MVTLLPNRLDVHISRKLPKSNVRFSDVPMSVQGSYCLMGDFSTNENIEILVRRITLINYGF